MREADAMNDSSGKGSGGLEALYPFLYGSRGGLEQVYSQVRQSTAAKADEVVRLRESTVAQLGGRMLECAATMARAFDGGGRLFTFGNGGSATDAQALAHAFMFPPAARPLPALALVSDVATLTALGNDVGFDTIFARQLGALARRGDIAVGISTSGNSANLLRAFDEACRRGLLTIGLAGDQGGKMALADTLDFLFVVPSSSVHRIQEVQTTLYHLLCELTQDFLTQREAP
jgi:D-sedoheptulose 7-phosphate isomerase